MVRRLQHPMIWLESPANCCPALILLLQRTMVTLATPGGRVKNKLETDTGCDSKSKSRCSIVKFSNGVLALCAAGLRRGIVSSVSFLKPRSKCLPFFINLPVDERGFAPVSGRTGSGFIVRRYMLYHQSPGAAGGETAESERRYTTKPRERGVET